MIGPPFFVELELASPSLDDWLTALAIVKEHVEQNHDSLVSIVVRTREYARKSEREAA